MVHPRTGDASTCRTTCSNGKPSDGLNSMIAPFTTSGAFPTLLPTAAYLQRSIQQSVGVAAPELKGKIAYARGGALWLYQNGQQHQLTKGPKDRADKRDAQPTFSPDGAESIYTRFDEGFSDL